MATESALVNAGLLAGLFDADTVARLRGTARVQRVPLAEALARELRLPATALYLALAQAHGLRFLRSDEMETDAQALARLPAALLRRHLVVPVRSRDGEPWLAIADPDDLPGIDGARRLLGEGWPLALAEPESLQPRVPLHVSPDARTRSAELAPVALLERIAREAWLRRASDIHIEAQHEGGRVRFRVDGRLQSWNTPLPRELTEALISRIKVLAGMDIAENRAPQDGSFTYALAEWGDEPVELRAACVPTRHGERMTLRLMKNEGTHATLDTLGMPAAMTSRLRAVLASPHGLVLVTGPTGSGKSTTLYAALRQIDARTLNVLTVEDPVEQSLADISQVQVSERLGFAGTLRAFLRHDPDVILVGEIRDRDTAQTALQAATTGHMVLSTLHTNHAPGAITRLIDLGAERYLIAATLRAVIAQRLVRRLCPHCKRERSLNLGECHAAGLDSHATPRVFDPIGCPHCLGTGHGGRIGLFEALWLDETRARVIARGGDERELLDGADASTLAEDARAKLLAGEIGFDEALPFLTRLEAQR